MQVNSHCKFRGFVPCEVLNLLHVKPIFKTACQKCVSQKMWRNLKVNTAFNRSIPSLLRRVGFSSVYAFPHRPERWPGHSFAVGLGNYKHWLWFRFQLSQLRFKHRSNRQIAYTAVGLQILVECWACAIEHEIPTHTLGEFFSTPEFDKLEQEIK